MTAFWPCDISFAWWVRNETFSLDSSFYWWFLFHSILKYGELSQKSDYDENYSLIAQNMVGVFKTEPEEWAILQGQIYVGWALGRLIRARKRQILPRVLEKWRNEAIVFFFSRWHAEKSMFRFATKQTFVDEIVDWIICSGTHPGIEQLSGVSRYRTFEIRRGAVRCKQAESEYILKLRSWFQLQTKWGKSLVLIWMSPQLVCQLSDNIQEIKMGGSIFEKLTCENKAGSEA